MLNNSKRWVILSVVFLLNLLQVEAQTSCTQVLKNAQKLFDHGQLSSIADSLTPCLKNEGFTRDEKLQAYRLLVITNLVNDEPLLAEQNLLNLLNEDPEYKINTAIDPAEFVNLYNCYRTKPVFSLGFSGGINFTRIRNAKAFGIHNSDVSKGKYKMGLGFQAGPVADIRLSDNFLLNSGLFFEVKNYSYENVLFDYSSLFFEESQIWLELPVAIKYQFGKTKFSPYLLAGISGQMLFSAKAAVSRKNESSGENEAVGPSINVKNIRNDYNIATQLGTGFRYKLGYGYLILDARYTVGMRFAGAKDTKYSNSELVYKYGYLDNDYFVDNIIISVGYLKNFYKPKKVKSLNE